MTIKKDSRDHIALLIDTHTNHLIDVTPVTDSDHAHFLEIKFLHDIPLPFDLRDQEILDFLHLSLNQIQEINLIQSNHKPKMIKLTLRYICITQPKWQTL